MPFDFPNAPSVGQTATAPNGGLFIWDGAKWVNGGGPTPPALGPFLPLAGNATVTGPTTFSAATTLSAGGTLTGTFAGTPTWSGAHIFSGTVALNGGGSLTGTFSGASTWSGLNTFSAAGTGLSVTNNATVGGTFASGAQTINGAATITGTNMLQVGNNIGANNFVRILPTAIGSTPVVTTVGGDTNIGLNITPQGIGVVAAPRLQLGVANMTLSGTFASNQSPFSISTNVLGTSTDPYRNITQLNINSDNVVASVIQAFGINHNYGGTAAKGSRIAFSTGLVQTAATQNTVNTFYQGCQFSATAAYQEPGSTAPTRTGAAGILFSGSSTATLGSGAINYSGLAGWEFDVVAGAQPWSVLGISVVRLTGGFGSNYQANEPSIDSGFRVGSGVANSAAWVNGYTVTSPTSNFALDATKGTAFIVFPGQDYQVVKPAAKTGIDLSYVAFNQAAWHSQGAIIDPTGVGMFKGLGLGNWSANVTSTGLTIDPAGVQIALTAVVASGGTSGSAMGINEQFSFAGNGRGIVTAVAAGVVTGIAILEYPTASSPPANPVAATSLMFSGAGQSTGSGLTLNLTWSAANGLSLNPTGQRIGFNGTAPIAKPTVSGAKGSNAALASLMTALAAYGLVTDTTTA